MKTLKNTITTLAAPLLLGVVYAPLGLLLLGRRLELSLARA
jgi:hypothetical protein